MYNLNKGKKMTRTKINITRKQALEMLEQLKNDYHYIPYESKTDFYYSFLSRGGDVCIAIYKYDRKYVLQIDSLD
jgi:hypothetical protein